MVAVARSSSSRGSAMGICRTTTTTSRTVLPLSSGDASTTVLSQQEERQQQESTTVLVSRTLALNNNTTTTTTTTPAVVGNRGGEQWDSELDDVPMIDFTLQTAPPPTATASWSLVKKSMRTDQTIPIAATSTTPTKLLFAPPMLQSSTTTTMMLQDSLVSRCVTPPNVPQSKDSRSKVPHPPPPSTPDSVLSHDHHGVCHG